MVLSRSTLGTLCLGWAFALLLGLSLGTIVPLILLLIWSVLLLIP